MSPGADSKGRRPLRFLLAGVANTIFGLGVYPLLLWSSAALQHHYMLALGIAQSVSLCFAFATYKLGVLRVIFTKALTSKPKKITIKSVSPSDE